MTNWMADFTGMTLVSEDTDDLGDPDDPMILVNFSSDKSLEKYIIW